MKTQTQHKILGTIMSLAVAFGAMTGLALASPENTAYAAESSSDVVLDYEEEGFINEKGIYTELVGFVFDQDGEYTVEKGSSPLGWKYNVFSDVKVASYHDMLTDTSLRKSEYVFGAFTTTARTSKESEKMYKDYICQAGNLPGAYVDTKDSVAKFVSFGIKLGADSPSFPDISGPYAGATGNLAVIRMAMAMTSSSKYEVYDYVVDFEASRKMGCIVSYYLYRDAATNKDVRELGITPYAEGHVKITEGLSLGGYLSNHKNTTRTQTVLNDEKILKVLKYYMSSEIELIDIPDKALTTAFTYGGALGIWLWDPSWENSHTMTGAWLENPDTYQEDGIMHIATLWTRASDFTPPRPERNDNFYVATRAMAGCRLRAIEKDDSNEGSELYYEDKLILTYTCRSVIGFQNYKAKDLVSQMSIAVSLGKQLVEQDRHANLALAGSITLSNADTPSEDTGAGGSTSVGGSISGGSKPTTNGDNIWGAIGDITENDKTGYAGILIVVVILIVIILVAIFTGKLIPFLKTLGEWIKIAALWIWSGITAIGLWFKNIFTKKGGKKE